MLLINKIEKVSELQAIFQDKENVMHLIHRFYQNFLVCKKIQDLKQFKIRGESPVDILLILLILPYIQFATISGLLNSANGNFVSSQKDAYYRFKNNSLINWRSILYSITKRYKKIVAGETRRNGDFSSYEEGFTCLIGDDTLLPKSGKYIEKVSMVFDHVTKRPVLGFKALVLGFYDGVCIRPVDFSFHREKGKNKKRPFGFRLKDLRNQFRANRDSSSASLKRLKETDMSKIDVLIEMVKRASKNGLGADYLLVDSWFFCDEMIKSIRKIKNGSMHIVAACKMDNRKYVYNGREYTAKELLHKFKSSSKRCRGLRYRYIKVEVLYKGTQIILFFNRASGMKKWKLIATTNDRLGFKEVMKIYSRRWTIEVFFKEMKQHMNAGKCQSNNFDAQICDFTISCINYIVLSIHKRYSSYETIGGIFEGTKAIVIEQTIADKIWVIFLKIIEEILDILGFDIFDVMQKIVSDNEKGKKILKILNFQNSLTGKDEIFGHKFNNVA